MAGERKPYPPAFRKTVPASVEDLKLMESQVEELVRQVSPSVVAVRVGNSAGSAVVISEDGLVLCAAHVCGTPHAPVVFKFPDGRTARGETLGADHDMDAGLMRITDPGPWPFAPLGAVEGVHEGDWVVALGHPGGFDPERSVVVRLGRVIRQSRFLQTDCLLISGDSGGPLFDVYGRVLGIHSRISQATTGNFHVPLRSYLENWDRLVKAETWGEERSRLRPTIGVHAVDHSSGCRLERVNEGGPGDQAGLRPGDIILTVDNTSIADAAALAKSIRQIEPGSDTTVVVKRGGVELSLIVKVETRRGRGGGGGRSN
ncbi:MAG: S1C family serine protease [Verrucomicrobiota bacterium]